MARIHVITDAVTGKTTTRAFTAEEEAEFDAMSAPTAGDVKAEAERRILAIMPEYRQRNTLALFAEAVLKYGADPANWPADLQSANQQAMAVWEAIKAIRSRSDEIEQMTPIPADFAADQNWPAAE